ncbi:MAG: M16 family metallopeptidase [Candidatus Krumholzibacteriia bacterium]
MTTRANTLARAAASRPGRAFLAAVALATCALLCALPAPAAAGGSAIPARPEQLTFPSLKYSPPDAKEARVELKNGIVAYLVPDHALPLVSVHVLMRIGPDLDPAGREGLASLMVGQLTRGGTAKRTATEVEDLVSALGATLDSAVGGRGGGFMGMGGVPIGPAEGRASIILLSKDLATGLALLAECLREPAFADDRLQLAKDQLVQSMKERNDSTAQIEEREWGFLTRGDGFWGNLYPTQASVDGLTRADLAAFARRYVGPRNFLLAVSGDFDRAAMIRALDKAFANWPVPGERPGPPPGPTAPAAPGWYVVDKDVNQARVSFGLRTIDRYDPDWFAALVMNDILGGGGFSARLVNRIRSDEGLAYSVRSRQEGGVYWPDTWRVSFQTKVRSAAYAIDVGLTEVRRIREARVSDEELQTTKNKFIETFPTQFETAGAIAGALAVEELTGRYAKDPHYFAEYRDRVAAVTAADVQRVAQRLLDPAKMTFLLVGKVDDMLLGDGKHDVSLVGLAGGEPRRLPLRDPLTMKPLAD